MLRLKLCGKLKSLYGNYFVHVAIYSCFCMYEASWSYDCGFYDIYKMDIQIIIDNSCVLSFKGSINPIAHGGLDTACQSMDRANIP